MAVQGVGRRYAEAVFDLAMESNTQDQWMNALQTLASAAEDDETSAYFENPAIDQIEKERALEILLGGDGNTEVRNLARLLIDRQRFDTLPSILEAFDEMVLRSRGISIADVTTAIPLSDSESAQIGQQLARIIGTQVEVRSHVDEAIIGGIVARIGDQLIDGSVRTQLRDLRSTLGRR